MLSQHIILLIVCDINEGHITVHTHTHIHKLLSHLNMKRNCYVLFDEGSKKGFRRDDGNKYSIPNNYCLTNE